jgi:hypothetical protein
MTDAEVVLYKIQRFQMEPLIKANDGVFDEEKFNKCFALMLTSPAGVKMLAEVEAMLETA